MNSGAIKFSEKHWQSMSPEAAVELMYWLDTNMEPGYQIIKSGTGHHYFVGDSDSLFMRDCQNQRYDIYNLIVVGKEFKTEAEQHCTLTL